MNGPDQKPQAPEPKEGQEDPARTRLCPHWHKPCVEAREQCYFWITARHTELSRLGVPKEVVRQMCLYHAIMEAAVSPKVVMAQPGGPTGPPGIPRG